MPQLLLSKRFRDWLARVSDSRSKARILARIRSAEAGNFGDCKALEKGLFELRVHYGPGFRIYYARRGEDIFLLLAGGTKSTQSRDIRSALAMLNELKGTDR